MKISAMMSPDPIFVDKQTSVLDALVLLDRNTFRHIPVTHEGALVGIVSEVDLSAYKHPRLGGGNRDEITELLNDPVIHIMESSVLYVRPNDELEHVVRLMVENRVGALPVVDTKRNTLVGIISYIDVLSWALNKGCLQENQAD